MAKKRRFDFTKKNKRSGKVENVGYLDLEQDEEQSRCSLYFYGDIVSATWESMWFEEDRCPQDIADFLNQLDGYEDIDIYFNSGGGDVFAGLAIYNQLKRYSGHKVGYVDGMAASIASVIMFAYQRRNIKKATKEDADGKKITGWQREEREMSREEYDRLTLMQEVVASNTTGIVESVTQFQKDAVIDEYTQQLIEEGLI